MRKARTGRCRRRVQALSLLLGTMSAGLLPAAQAPRPRASATPAPVADPRPLDLNRASADEISRLPGVGPSLARRIVEERDRRGRFESPDGLRGILGLGPKKLAALREHVTVGD